MRRPVRRYWGTPRDAAVRPVVPWRGRLARFVRLAGAALGAAALLVGADRALHVATTSPAFAVRAVQVEGAVHEDPEQLAAATGARGANVFRLDLAAVRERLLARPWVADASVRRVVPDTLVVRVLERTPVARWQRAGGEALVDGAGVVVAEGAEAARFEVPRIEGAEDAAALALAAATVQALREAAPQLHAALRRLEVTGPQGMTLHAEGQPPVLVSGPDSVDEVVGWLEHGAALGRQLGPVRQVDARWRDRLFVRPDEG